MSEGFKIDFIVEGKVIVELKSVEMLLQVHESQLLTYMRLSGKELGLLINFNVPLLKDGIRRKIMTKNTQIDN
ncbi:MAG: GxxExxY protein [Sulfurovum sp.]|nr:GxxExxY protein [Sulfurovum sp.]NNJ45951.1 GxxExxY protein [Sulfurovum sp.]